MTPSWVQAGRKVVCITGGWGNALWRSIVLNRPVKGGIYTIRSVQMGASCADGSEMVGVYLEEIHNLSIMGPVGAREPDFSWEGFRPVDERKTDISIFQQMLKPTHVDA